MTAAEELRAHALELAGGDVMEATSAAIALLAMLAAASGVPAVVVCDKFCQCAGRIAQRKLERFDRTTSSCGESVGGEEEAT